MFVRRPLREQDGGSAGAGASGAAPAAPHVQPAAAPAAPAVDEKAIEERALAAYRKKHGITSDDDVVAALKAKKDAEDKNLSDLDKAHKALDASEKNRATEVADATAKAAKAEAEAKAAKAEAEELRMHLRLISGGVNAKDVDIVALRLAKAKDADGKDFDEGKALDKIRAEYANLFGGAQPAAPATVPGATVNNQTPAAALGANPIPGPAQVDWLKLRSENPAEYARLMAKRPH